MAVDVTRAMAKMTRAEKQLRFAAAVALTRTAKAVAGEITGEMDQTFDQPTAWTKRAMAIKPATKETLRSEVFVKDQQVEALARQEVGGERTPKKGSPILVPVNLRTNKAGNIPKGRIARELAKENTFFASGQDKRTRHLPPGVYQRNARGTRRGGGRGSKGSLKVGTGRKAKLAGGAAFKGKLTSLRLLVAMEKQAQYEPRFRLRRRVHAKAPKHFEREFETSRRDALKTAR